MKYQKKPIIVEAWKAIGLYPNMALPSELVVGFPHNGNKEYTVYDKLHDTHIKFEAGDWIIKGIKGEYYPCKEDVFLESYEPVKE